MKRRDFLSRTAVGVGFVAFGGVALAGKGRSRTSLPFPYVKLNPETVSHRAYTYYHEHHCAYAVFASIVDELKLKVGAPYTGIPSELLVYGRGGVVGWGTLCGALNGAGAVFTLASKDYKKLIDALYEWYQSTPLPVYTPPGKKPYPVSVARSPLCHMSVQRWCKSASRCFGCKVPYNAKERSERCARLSADVAGKVVELLNEYHFGKVAPVKVKSAEKTKMECTLCHQFTEKRT
jgi:hypothetical protein